MDLIMMHKKAFTGCFKGSKITVNHFVGIPVPWLHVDTFKFFWIFWKCIHFGFIWSRNSCGKLLDKSVGQRTQDHQNDSSVCRIKSSIQAASVSHSVNQLTANKVSVAKTAKSTSNQNDIYTACCILVPLWAQPLGPCIRGGQPI